MTPKKPFNKVEGLFSARRKIEKEIEIIQKNCNHPTKSIKQIQERLDTPTMVIRWICDSCSRIIGIPNNKDIQNYLKK
jgi:RNase P subunit RPR2